MNYFFYSSSNQNIEYKKTSFLTKSNSAFIEQMYLKFINNDNDLPESWKNYFLDLGEEIDLVAKEIKGPSWNPVKKKIEIVEIKQQVNKKKLIYQTDQIDLAKTQSQSIRAVSLIRSYRQRGHLLSKLDPLEIRESEYLEALHPENYGFSKKDYEKNI